MNKKQKNRLKIYSYFAIALLAVYSVLITIFLANSHIEIKRVYTQIDERKVMNKIMLEKIEKILEENKSYISRLDLETDDSIQKFVSADKSFTNKGYVPENLVSISSEYIADLKGGTQRLRTEANKALQKMGKDFFENYNRKIAIVSAYRSYNYQLGIKNRGCPDNLCAKAGFSEHQSGLAFDVWEASTEKQFKSNKSYNTYFSWLNDNAYVYGFTNTYQKGLEIDTYEIEPWHWRYVGIELASYLHQNEITFAEFYTEK